MYFQARDRIWFAFEDARFRGEEERDQRMWNQRGKDYVDGRINAG